jgi:hypothetical protein
VADRTNAGTEASTSSLVWSSCFPFRRARVRFKRPQPRGSGAGTARSALGPKTQDADGRKEVSWSSASTDVPGAKSPPVIRCLRRDYRIPADRPNYHRWKRPENYPWRPRFGSGYLPNGPKDGAPVWTEHGPRLVTCRPAGPGAWSARLPEPRVNPVPGSWAQGPVVPPSGGAPVACGGGSGLGVAMSSYQVADSMAHPLRCKGSEGSEWADWPGK